jgi:hypothetical protein
MHHAEEEFKTAGMMQLGSLGKEKEYNNFNR